MISFLETGIRRLGELNESIGRAFPSAEAKAAAIRKQENDAKAQQAREADQQQVELYKAFYGIKSQGDAEAEARADERDTRNENTRFNQGRTILADTIKGKRVLNDNTTDNRIRELTTQQGFFDQTLQRLQNHDLAVNHRFLGDTSLADNYFKYLNTKQDIVRQELEHRRRPRSFGETLVDVLPGVAGLIGLLVA